MNIYKYNSSTINEYSQEDFGFICESSREVDDCGNLSDTNTSIENFYYIDCSKTLYPFGGIKLKSKKVKYSIDLIIGKKYLDINKKSIVLQGIIIRWIGFSVIFQLSNDSQRKVIPDVSGGGAL